MELIHVMDTATATVLVALITLVGSITATIFAYLGSRQAKQANRAVNNVQPGMPKLYDIVAQTQKDFIAHVTVNGIQHEELHSLLRGNYQEAAEERQRIADELAATNEKP